MRCPACRKAKLEDVTDPRLDAAWEYECPKCGYRRFVRVEPDESVTVEERYPPGTYFKKKKKSP